VQRFLAASKRRNYFVTRLVAEIAENYYSLMALDKRLETLDRIIALQERSRNLAKARMEAARGTELPVQRFQAEVRKNESEKLIVKQEIVQVEERINFLVNRFQQPVERMSAGFLDLNIRMLSVGVPAQLLLNRPDIRQAERELVAAGLDVKVARTHFFPRLDITGGVGYEAFSPKYLFWTPGSLVLQCRRCTRSRVEGDKCTARNRARAVAVVVVPCRRAGRWDRSGTGGRPAFGGVAAIPAHISARKVAIFACKPHHRYPLAARGIEWPAREGRAAVP
jgi:hypothetical protein